MSAFYSRSRSRLDYHSHGRTSPPHAGAALAVGTPKADRAEAAPVRITSPPAMAVVEGLAGHISATFTGPMECAPFQDLDTDTQPSIRLIMSRIFVTGIAAMSHSSAVQHWITLTISAGDGCRRDTDGAGSGPAVPISRQ